MARAFIILPLLIVLGGCASYEAEPVSVYQWERKVQEVERREAERQRLCQTLDKESARYERECAGVKS